RDGGRAGRPVRRLRLQLGEQLFERLHGKGLSQLITSWRRTAPGGVTCPRLPGMPRRNILTALSSAALILAALAACAPADESPSAGSSPSPSEEACPQGALDTKTAGKLTVATDNPAYEPWVVDNKPENGKGFESAVAYQVAQRL